MSDRTAFFGETLEAARYRFGDTSTDGGNYIVAEDLDGERVLLQFDYDADEWQYAGDVNLGGGDLNSVGTARVDALEADQASIGKTITTVSLSGNQTIPAQTVTQVEFDNVIDDEFGTVDTTNYEIEVPETGRYLILYVAGFSSSDDWTNGDDLRVRAEVNESSVTEGFKLKTGNSREYFNTPLYAFSLSAGDVVAFELFQNSGVDQTLLGGDTDRTRASVVRLG